MVESGDVKVPRLFTERNIVEGVEDSLYSEDAPQKAPEGKPDSVDEQESMNPTALVDLKVLTGKHGSPKEGDEIVVKVVKVHGDQAEVEYAPEKDDESAESAPDNEMEELNSKF